MDLALYVILLSFCLFGVAMIANALGRVSNLEVHRRCLGIGAIGSFYAGCLLGCTGVFWVVGYAYSEWGGLGVAVAVPSYVAALSYIATKAVPEKFSGDDDARRS
jgi:hypothetical protein